MSVKQKSNNKIIAWIIVLMLALVAMCFYVINGRKTSTSYVIPATLKIDGTVLSQQRFINDFKLQSTAGGKFTKQSLKGHWSLMFFGYTNCAYACPMTMAEMNKMYKVLVANLEKAEIPQIIMVSVDPERDSLARLSSYVHAFNPHFIGARADVSSDLKKLSNQLNVVFSKTKSKDANPKHYIIHHSAEVMVLNPNGNLVAFLSFPHTASSLVKDYEDIVSSSRDAQLSS